MKTVFEIGDWVRFKDSRHVYLVVGLAINNCVQLNGLGSGRNPPSEEMLEIVRKNNKPEEEK